MTDNGGTRTSRMTTEKGTKLREVTVKKSYLFGLYKKDITMMADEDKYLNWLSDKTVDDAVSKIMNIIPMMVAVSGLTGLVGKMKKHVNRK